MSCEILLEELKERDIEIWREEDNIRFKCSGESLTENDVARIREMKADLLSVLSDSPLNDADLKITNTASSFNLSPMQEAYWIGEQSFYNNSCVAFYYHRYEVEDLDINRFNSAITALVSKHDALRLTFDENGQQSFLKKKKVHAEVHDLTLATDIEITDYIQNQKSLTESKLSGESTSWPFLFEVYQTEKQFYVTFSLRLMVVDGVSFNIIIDELIKLYHGETGFNHTSMSYRQYIEYLQDRNNSDEYNEAKLYWNNKLDNIYPAPELPLSDEIIHSSLFKRKQGRLSSLQWKSLQRISQEAGVSINTVLCTAYCDVLRMFSKSEQFTLNMLAADRPLELDGFDRLVGNCSTTMLLEINHQGQTFIERCEAIRNQVFENYSYSSVSGVELIRSLQVKRGVSDRPLMPIVFTSGLDLHDGSNNFCVDDQQWHLQETYLKTPQVWLDHQVYQEYDELVFNWDYVPSVFSPNLVETMYKVYSEWLINLAENKYDWYKNKASISQSQCNAFLDYNDVHAPLPAKLLHQGFVDMACDFPNKIAVISAQSSITYGEMYEAAVKIAISIQKTINSNENIVAVFATKGIEQLTAVMGILISGNSYLPIDSKLPTKRVVQILKHSECKLVITDDVCAAKAKLISDVAIQEISKIQVLDNSELKTVDVDVNSRAYVIYTSGSTGVPKGVSISHLGAMNTIEDMIRRFGLQPEDKVLALSALNFDLSVYDIFASLLNGATVVIPTDQEIPDPTVWCELVEKYEVTVWNSVPALMEMTLEYLKDKARLTLKSIRLILMSGDWVSRKLVQDLRDILPNQDIIALGGATEASIWSNYYRIGADIPEGWQSVPYGVPLSNQSMLVLDKFMDQRPDWVEGELYIGGSGLAIEYLHDHQKTQEAFVVHPQTGERLYRTGDVARTRNGMIEFLGRKDFQVKIRGYRIELKEIEAHLEKYDEIRLAAVIVHDSKNNGGNLVAFYSSISGQSISDVQLRDYLSSTLPNYMVPAHFQHLKSFPLSANGKIDVKALTPLVDLKKNMSNITELPASKVERLILSVWESLLDEKVQSINLSFFDIGGNSLLAVRLRSKIEELFGVQIPLGKLFEANTIKSLAHEVQRHQESSAGCERLTLLSKAKGSDVVYFIHPVGGNILSYISLANIIPTASIWGIQCHDEDAHSSLSMQETAELYTDIILEKHGESDEPIRIGGWSMGAVFSITVIFILEQRGYDVIPPLLIDPWVANPDRIGEFTLKSAIHGFFNDVLQQTLPILDMDYEDNMDIEDAFIQSMEAYKNSGVTFALDKNELFEIFQIYYRNSIILRNHNIDIPRTPCFLLLAGNNGEFSSLQPINNAFPDINIEYQEQFLNKTHWTVMEEDSLAPIVRKWMLMDINKYNRRN